MKPPTHPQVSMEVFSVYYHLTTPNEHYPQGRSYRRIIYRCPTCGHEEDKPIYMRRRYFFYCCGSHIHKYAK